jgi:hypothetical protein
MTHETTDWQIGDLARHKPTGLVGRVHWLPFMEDLPFMYIEIPDETHGAAYRQGEVKEFERV